jgi:hypothetical protein
MKLFIRIKDGQPFEHPILESNFKQAFPKININNLPSEFSCFERVEAPFLGPYEKNQRVQYQLSEDGVYRDVWYCDQMSEEEKTEKQNRVKEQWTQNGGFASWTFNEETCSFVAPTPYPNDGLFYVWNEETLTWVQTEIGAPNGS